MPDWSDVTPARLPAIIEAASVLRVALESRGAGAILDARENFLSLTRAMQGGNGIDGLPADVRCALQAAWDWIYQGSNITAMRTAVEDLLALGDGPKPPNWLEWKGQKWKMQPVPWKLLRHMWGRDVASFDELAEAVWGESVVTSGQVKVAVTKINSTLGQAGVPFTLHVEAQHVKKSSE
ncbi:MAG: hypothetical protein AB7K24_03995 [Gemmataceae bacterium]